MNMNLNEELCKAVDELVATYSIPGVHAAWLGQRPQVQRARRNFDAHNALCALTSAIAEIMHMELNRGRRDKFFACIELQDKLIPVLRRVG